MEGSVDTPASRERPPSAAGDNGRLPPGRSRDPRRAPRPPGANGSSETGVRGWSASSDGPAANGHRSGSLPLGLGAVYEQVQEEPPPPPPPGSGATLAEMQMLRAKRERLEAENRELRREAAPAVRLAKDVEIASSDVESKRLKVQDMEEQVEHYDKLFDALNKTMNGGHMAL